MVEFSVAAVKLMVLEHESVVEQHHLQTTHQCNTRKSLYQLDIHTNHQNDPQHNIFYPGLLSQMDQIYSQQLSAFFDLPANLARAYSPKPSPVLLD